MAPYVHIEPTKLLDSASVPSELGQQKLQYSHEKTCKGRAGGIDWMGSAGSNWAGWSLMASMSKDGCQSPDCAWPSGSMIADSRTSES